MSNTISELRAENKKVQTRNQILAQVKETPELLKTVSIERLKEINMMFDEQISENARKIDYLNNRLQRLQSQ